MSHMGSRYNHFPPNLPKVVIKTWGSEEIIINSEEDNYCGKRMTLTGGKRCSIHYHLKKNETFFCQGGEFNLEVWDQNGEMETIAMTPGKSYQLNEGTPHRFTGVAPYSIFFEFSTFDNPMDTYRVEPGD